jgi:hypothetical protein
MRGEGGMFYSVGVFHQGLGGSHHACMHVQRPSRAQPSMRNCTELGVRHQGKAAEYLTKRTTTFSLNKP